MATFECKYAIGDKVTAQHDKKSRVVEGEITGVSFYPEGYIYSVRHPENGYVTITPYYEHTIKPRAGDLVDMMEEPTVPMSEETK